MAAIPKFRPARRRFSLYKRFFQRRHQVYLLTAFTLWAAILVVRSCSSLSAEDLHVALSRGLPIQTFSPLESRLGDEWEADEYQEDDELPPPPKALIGKMIDVPTDTLEYHEIFSRTTKHMRYAPLYFDGIGVTDPSIIPHPIESDMWIVTARREQSLDDHMREEQLVCKASFYEDVLVCADGYTVMPTAASRYGTCPFQHDDLNHRFGPMDLRLFYGPMHPYITYGSQSRYTCRNVWLQDARHLLDDFRMESVIGSQLYNAATEMQRPGEWDTIERDYFMFWDDDGNSYVQSNLWPRVFGKLENDGSFARNLAPWSITQDTFCVEKYMPKVKGKHESLRQGSNSLLVTLCKRSDTRCKPSDFNTFIMHIFHTRTEYHEHAIHEPYVMLFDRSPPFAMRAIGQQPLWVAGRKKLQSGSSSLRWAKKNSSEIPEGHTESFLITSLSWSTHGMKYHGYADDAIWLSFGIEETGAGIIDVQAGDLLAGLSFC